MGYNRRILFNFMGKISTLKYFYFSLSKFPTLPEDFPKKPQINIVLTITKKTANLIELFSRSTDMRKYIFIYIDEDIDIK